MAEERDNPAAAQARAPDLDSLSDAEADELIQMRFYLTEMEKRRVAERQAKRRRGVRFTWMRWRADEPGVHRRRCRVCRRWFYTAYPLTGFCSDTCRMRAAHRRRARWRAAARRGKKCEQCKRKFTPKRADAKFCSNKCRQASHRAAGVTITGP